MGNIQTGRSLDKSKRGNQLRRFFFARDLGRLLRHKIDREQPNQSYFSTKHVTIKHARGNRMPEY